MKPFDITDRRSKYQRCPKCSATFGMGLVTRGRHLAVECTECGHRGPEVEVPEIGQWAAWSVPSHERDRQAFEGWNSQKLAPAAMKGDSK